MLKDDDFKDRVLYLGGLRSKFIKQLERDTKWLSLQKLISYHVLVGIHEAKHAVSVQKDEDRRTELAMAIEEDEIFKHLELAQIRSQRDDKQGEEIYFIGITGLFQTYSTGRRMQHKFSGVFRRQDNLSVVDHEFYQQRLIRFMREHIE
eukprot:jgi/Bigna1/72803/fgenesh1_pg.21_\